MIKDFEQDARYLVHKLAQSLNLEIADSYVDGTKIMEVLKEQGLLLEVRNDAQYYLCMKDELPYYVPYNTSGFKLKPNSNWDNR